MLEGENWNCLETSNNSSETAEPFNLQAWSHRQTQLCVLIWRQSLQQENYGKLQKTTIGNSCCPKMFSTSSRLQRKHPLCNLYHSMKCCISIFPQHKHKVSLKYSANFKWERFQTLRRTQVLLLGFINLNLTTIMAFNTEKTAV